MSFFWPIAQAKRDDSVTSHDAGERTAGVRQPGEITRTPDLGPSQQPSMVQNDSEREDTAHDRAVRELLGLGLETSSPSNSNNAGGTSGLPNDRAGAGAGAGAGATVNALNSGSAAFPPGPEKIYDPATGSLAGFIRQNQNGNGTGDVGGVQSAHLFTVTRGSTNCTDAFKAYKTHFPNNNRRTGILLPVKLNNNSNSQTRTLHFQKTCGINYQRFASFRARLHVCILRWINLVLLKA